jgi:hypothetical protein
MCYAAAPSRGDGAFNDDFFDYGNDDYWDPPTGAPLAWWTVDLSRFICDTASCNHAGQAGDSAPELVREETAERRTAKTKLRRSPKRATRVRRRRPGGPARPGTRGALRSSRI